MRASVIPAAAAMAKRPPVQKSTAYYIFHPDERITYELSNAHFKAKNNQLNQPVITDGSRSDMDRLSSSLIATSGTVMEIIDQFMLGATIRFPDPKTAEIVYTRIAKHLDAHLQAMRSDITYVAPEAEDFRQMAEFATSIRHLARMSNENLDKSVSRSTMSKVMEMRPRFNVEDPKVKPADVDVPKPVSQMDAIERYLEMSNGR